MLSTSNSAAAPLLETPSQTAGPYVHIGCLPRQAGLQPAPTDLGTQMCVGPVAGRQIMLCGMIYDGAGEVVRDAMIEIWQPDAAGRFAGSPDADPNFTCWGRSDCTEGKGEYRFETVMPGALAAEDGAMRAPFITMWIVARGINIGLQTRVYFADAPENAQDPVLAVVRDTGRADTLLAHPTELNTYRFDIHLQGAQETVFFDI